MLKNYLIAIFVMFLWGTNTTLCKFVIGDVEPLFFNFLRYAITALILIPIVPMPRGQWRQALMTALLFCFLHSGLLMLSLKNLDASLASVLGRTGLIFATIFSFFLLGEKLNGTKIVGIVIALIGTYIMAGQPTNSGHGLYVLAILISYISWGLFNIFLKTRDQSVGYLSLIGWGALFSLPLLLGLSLIFETTPWIAVTTLSGLSWLIILYSSVVAIIITYVLYQRLLQVMQVSELASFTLLVPVFGVTSSVLGLNEKLTPSFLIGAALTLMGIFFTSVLGQRFARRKQNAIPIED